jgi:hypothetical protein
MSDDPELQAIERMVNEVMALHPEARARVLQYITARCTSQGIFPSLLGNLTPSNAALGSFGGVLPLGLTSSQQVFDILSTVATALSAAGGIAGFVGLIKAWVDDRNGRKIRIKQGDFEVEFQGGISQDEIERRIADARKIKQQLASGAQAIEIIEP